MANKFKEQWDTTILELNKARSLLDECKGIGKLIAKYEEYLKHNELEIALDMLEEAGLEAQPKPSKQFWLNLKNAAELMGLEYRYNFFQEKIQNS